MKKYLTLLLLSLLPLAASAYDAKIDGIYYNLNKSANTASVTYKELDNENPVNDCTGDIVVPDEVTYEDVTYKVTAIEEKAFYNCGGLTSAIIPNSVKSIGSYAFYGCENLTSVNIPDGIMTIRDNTFYGCHNLVTMFIPYGVKTIGSSAFYECQALNSVYIPNSVTLIGNYSFQKCSGLTSVIIPNSVTYLGRYAYADCISLNFVSLGSGIETFADHVFSGCESLSLVHNLAETPVSAGDDVFDDAAKITLYFPKGSHPKYSTKDPWRIFNDWTIDAAHGKTPHTLTIAINGETYDTYTLLNGATIMLSDPYKEGHSFEGWLNTIPEMQDYDFTYNAIFTPNKYKLTYKIDGETVYSDDIAFGTNLTQDSPYSVPAKEGYKFSGWQGLPEKMPAHDVEVTGTYTIQKYKLTYILDGKEYKTYEIEYGATITPETDPEKKEGYTFSGWLGLPETMPAKDVEVTGSYTIMKFKLTYIVDDKTYKEFELEYGTTITPEADPEKEGYTFSGWSEIPETMPAKDVEVTGTFTVKKFKLTYILDDKTYKEFELEYGTTITPEADPEKEGYTFSGWSKIPETMPAHDVAVTGTFAINSYKLTYIVDGENYKEFVLEYGASITPEADPEKEGYTFSGWSKIPETMPAHDVVVTGTFTINSYKLTYMVDGENYKEFVLEYGATITPLEDLTKEGYTFSGWSEIPETMPAYDVIVTGSFSVKTYKLRYYVNGEQFDEYDIAFGETITYPQTPYKDGYRFVGWSEIPETMPAHDVEVTGLLVLIGDANGDGVLNIADIIQLLNYMSGHPSKDFVKAAADVSGSEEINEDDIISLVYLIMNLQ